MERELDKMRAETLGDAGVVLEIVIKQANVARLALEQNRRDYQLEPDRILALKIKAGERELDKLNADMERCYRNLVIQREAIGVFDHAILQEIYAYPSIK